MTASLYSLFMAILWFSSFILLGTFLQRKTGLVVCGNPIPLFIFLTLTVFRLMIPIETPFTVVVPSTGLYPAVRDLLQSPWITTAYTEISVMNVLLGIWGFVAVILCIKLCLQLYKDDSVIKRLPPIQSTNLDRYLEQCLLSHPCNRKVKLIISTSISTPMLVGLVTPKILLPQICDKFSEDELYYIFSHELTHLSNGDILAKFLVRILCCLLWWNPCVYLLQWELNSVLEYNCDLSVTKTMQSDDKIAYLQTILKLFAEKSSLSQESKVLQASFCGISENTVLKRRFQLVLNHVHRYKTLHKTAFIATLLMLFIASYSIILQPAYTPPAADLVKEILITAETSYILATSYNKYYLVYEGQMLETLSSERLNSDPYCFLPIQNMIEEN